MATKVTAKGAVKAAKGVVKAAKDAAEAKAAAKGAVDNRSNRGNVQQTTPKEVGNARL